MCITSQGQFFLSAVDVSNSDKSGEFLGKLFCEHIERVGPENVVCFVTDNAYNCTVAGQYVEEAFPHITWLGCLTHCLNLMMKDIGKLPWVKDTVAHVAVVRSCSATAHNCAHPLGAKLPRGTGGLNSPWLK